MPKKKAKKRATRAPTVAAQDAWSLQGKKEMMVNSVVRHIFGLVADADVFDDSTIALEVAELTADWLRSVTANGKRVAHA